MVGFGSEKIKSALVAALGLVLAIFLGYTLGSGGYEPIVLGFLIVSGLAFWVWERALFVGAGDRFVLPLRHFPDSRRVV